MSMEQNNFYEQSYQQLSAVDYSEHPSLISNQEAEAPNEARSIVELVTQFRFLISCKSYDLNFIELITRGPALFIGEGNMSFSLCMVKQPEVTAQFITATTYESFDQLSGFAKMNAAALRFLGATVMHGVDATKLECIFEGRQFETVIFQFPNCATRESIRGKNPNSILIWKFLKNAAALLRPQGKVLITTVKSPFYKGVFQFFEGAKKAGFSEPKIFPFYPSLYDGYVHTNTNENGSAIENHKKFCTWVFSKEAKISGQKMIS